MDQDRASNAADGGGGGGNNDQDGGGKGSGRSSPTARPDDRKRSLLMASMSPEDIVLCVDVGPEMTSEWAGAGTGGTATSRMLVVKMALRGFVRRKASFNPKHRFAVLALGDGVTVVRSLTSDVRSVIEAIDRLQPVQPSGTSLARDGVEAKDLDPPFDFSGLLWCISERFPPPKDAASMVEWSSRRGERLGTALMAGGTAGAGAGVVSQIRPAVRAILFFGRSYTPPLVPAGGAEKPALLTDPRFFLDCLYVHLPPAAEGVNCQEVFDSIAALETSAAGGRSYFLACGHSLKHFNANMSALLAHPAQRDFQATFFGKLSNPGGSAASGGAGGTGGSAQGSSAPLSSSAAMNALGGVAMT